MLLMLYQLAIPPGPWVPLFCPTVCTRIRGFTGAGIGVAVGSAQGSNGRFTYSQYARFARLEDMHYEAQNHLNHFPGETYTWALTIEDSEEHR